MLLPTLVNPTSAEAVRFGDLVITHADLAGSARATAAALAGRTRVAVWATPTPHTCLAVVGALAAGVPVVPLNPKVGERELAHILGDSAPELVLAEPDADLPPALAHLPRLHVDPAARGSGDLPAEPDPESPAFIVYTSGTTGPPKGVLMPRRAITSNLDALAAAWEWTAADKVVHGLPLFHVHGLILGVLGPLRLGGAVWHLGRFSSASLGEALAAGATVVFGVPTMYHRLAADCEASPSLAAVVGRARLLVSGSAALPATDHERITAATGQRVVERYGMTETLMNCGVRASGDRRAGTVGPPIDGVEVRVVDETGASVVDGEIGEIEVHGPNLFLGYLNRPDATTAALRDGWFRTGDMAIRDPDGYLRIVGRRATDLIKSGGYKIGAGEIENALMEHPGVAEVAVTGEPDEDLGERIVAWVVAEGEPPAASDLADHVARLLAPHKRPRVVHFLESLPRNEMGKVTKRALKVP
ncbi:acyl-CoA synthetase [Actinokineospora auranticolor]|uniref:Acyl-CoA synthetase (AMP-forming)/AMP-acid ligase II n=1 Tax=Actinokineospora auranticolor TaxID=155976 RepID=A0A2S6GWM4_9PSEU|nr:acyl-CoA synthetase [Actinokineospora auranticolor]PPK69603.1 acyl-CoA synthetase (AMP-forming)/AMP-acid ligase II [Actinokineospora auranticolor]